DNFTDSTEYTTEAFVYEIKPSRFLKGNYDKFPIRILDPLYGKILGEYRLSESKPYLFFFKEARIDSYFIQKYNLHDVQFFLPTHYFNLKSEAGLDYLKQTEEFLASLPPIPPFDTPTGILLDSLFVKSDYAFYQGWIGDKSFVNELNNHLDNAKKHLTKRDSANCSNEVEKFQEKVDKEYEKTIENEKKNKPRDKRFVTVEGWKFLYYNAQYILDRLPAIKKEDEEEEE
ncbi:MAG: hypothetical protein AB1728_12315, partial [Bacteroidota bacterium]